MLVEVEREVSLERVLAYEFGLHLLQYLNNGENKLSGKYVVALILDLRS